jgi:hypothetical protein
MAKLIEKKPPAETVYTLEFTERELGTLLTGIGATSQLDREESGRFHGVRILSDRETDGLYNFLRQTLGVKY